MGSTHGEREDPYAKSLSRLEALRNRNDFGAMLAHMWEEKKAGLMTFLNRPKNTKNITADCPSFALYDDPVVISKAEELIALGATNAELEETYHDFEWNIMKPFIAHLRAQTGGPRPRYDSRDIPASLEVENGYHDPVRRFKFNLETRQKIGGVSDQQRDETSGDVKNVIKGLPN